ncbi:MAG: hypothetical protein LBI84_01515 [Propionibacteriaceae bacterium]|nr:hypothetical protein [Propionibacteriaceae bacterium]
MMRWKSLGLAVAVILSICLPGCSPAAPEPEAADEKLADSLTEVFQVGLDTMNPSPVEREAIERAITTGQIDSADYEAAHLRYIQCLIKHDIQPTFRKTPEGLYVELPYFSPNGVADSTEANLKCSADNLIIGILYRIQQSNPDLLADNRLLAVRCLQKRGFVDADYTVDDFERNWTARVFPFVPSADGPSDCLYVAGYAYLSN